MSVAAPSKKKRDRNVKERMKESKPKESKRDLRKNSEMNKDVLIMVVALEVKEAYRIFFPLASAVILLAT